MPSAFELLAQSDALTRAILVLLLALSVASWVCILWKAWQLPRAQRQVVRATQAFWQAPSLPDALLRLPAFDPQQLVLPLARAVEPAPAGATLGSGGTPAQRAERALRDALQAGLARLQFGQTLLATTAATAPFIGLLGTVWGIYHALAALSGVRAVGIEQLAAPVGEALLVTAVGLAVAIPAVLGYNLSARRVALVEAELEGFAHDLLARFSA